MIAIIANPKAHRFSHKKLRAIIDTLKRQYSVDVFFTKKPKEGTAIANDIAGLYKIIAIYGGDGIINEVINADLKDSAVAVLPAGTTNVLAIELFGSPSIKLSVDAILKGKTKTAYTAKINDKYFILMAGAGFDGLSVKLVNNRLKHFSGKLAYVVAGIKAYLKPNKCFEAEIDGKKFNVLWAIATNASVYAGKFRISRSTNIFDNNLEVLLFDCKNPIFALPYYNGVLFFLNRFRMPCFKRIKTQKVLFKGCTIQIDGDLYEKNYGEINISKPIKIIVP